MLVEGIERAELLGLEQEEPFLKAETALFEPDGSAIYEVSEMKQCSGVFRNSFRDIAWKAEKSAKIWQQKS